MKISPIISVEMLLTIYRNTDVLIFDVSNSENAYANYQAGHLIGAVFVDLDTQLADIKKDLSQGGRHPLPSAEKFAQTLTELGISKEAHVVIYDDQSGANAAARFWWMLKAVGHEKVQVLNGGFTEAKRKQFPLSIGVESPQKTSKSYPTTAWQLPTIEMDVLESISQHSDYLVVDVRSQARYDGKSEPIDLIAGHIPGAVNIPLTDNLDVNGLFLAPDTLKNNYQTAFGDIKTQNIIVHCGSGVTACHTLLALDYAGMEIPTLYVGSWSEWSRNSKALSVTGDRN